MKKFILAIIIPLVISFSCESQKKQEKLIHEKTPVNAAMVDTVTVAGGCFWCVEAIFDRVEGVKEAVSGYSGGSEADANYEDVSYGRTDHAESVEIYFDPKMISYAELLEIFFATHDATQLNRQGPDIGRQYRTAIFYHNEAQRKMAEKYIAQLSTQSKYENKAIVTELTPYDEFYKAEDYHQDYYIHNPDNPYVISVTRPKVEKFMKEFQQKLKPEYR